MSNDDAELNELFGRYRDACAVPDPSQNFMPALWAKIEGRRGFLVAFGRLARTGMAAAAAFCILLAVLNLSDAPVRHLAPTYADALAADTQARTLYDDATHVPLPPESGR